MKRFLLITSTVALPLLSACSLLPNDPVPPSPTLTGVAAEKAAWQDDIQRARHGGLPSFEPLTSAQKAVAAAKAQPQVNQFDSQSLADADTALARAQDDWQTVGKQKKRSADDLARVADEAHRAQRLAEIAQYTAQRELGLTQLQSVNQQLIAQEQQQMAAGQDLVGQKVVPAMLGQIEFESGTARLSDASHQVVARLAKLMEVHADRGIAIFSFTSKDAPPEGQLQAFMQANPGLEKQAKTKAQQVEAYYQGLSGARARDVAQLLVQAGVDPQRIGARGFGSQHPLASNATEAGRRQNERVEAVVVPLKRQGG